MAAKKKQASAKKSKREARSARLVEFRFKIAAYSPESMPMARLAEYLSNLAEILGQSKGVHLAGIESGSTVPVLAIEREVIPEVTKRLDSVRSGGASRDSTEAFYRINRMLREDNAKAVFRRGRKGVRLLEFPGREANEEVYSSVNQRGELTGIINRVGGTGDQIPVLMEFDGRSVVGCHTNRELAKRLAKHLFEPVRMSGIGYWARDEDGVWNLKHYRIEGFEVLDDLPLREAVEGLRSLGSGWDADWDLEKIRHGVVGNGGD